MTVLPHMNEWLFELINGSAGRVPAIDWLGKLAAEQLFYALAAFLAGLGLWRLHHDRRAGMATAGIALASLGLTMALVLLLKHFIPEARPFVTEQDAHLIVHHSADGSFPSSHAANAVALGMLGALCWPKLAPATLGIATLVGIARIFVGVHYPDDVAFGLLLGAACSVAAWYCAKLPRRWARHPTLAPRPFS